MNDRANEPQSVPENGTPLNRDDLPAAAKRALAEAEERRRKADAAAKASGAEHGGPDGLDPTRYGDWERKGRAIDFS